MPDLPEDQPSSSTCTNRATMPSRRPPEHRRSYSAKTAIASIRNHLPRRSLDAKRHSCSDLVQRDDSRNSKNGRKAQHPKTLSQNDVLFIASRIALPSSPINVPQHAPSLSLDFSPIRLFTAPAIITEQIANDCRLANAEHISRHHAASAVVDSCGSCTASQPVDSVLMDPVTPVPEARESLQMKLKHEDSSHDDGIIESCQSPLPGTNQALDFDEHDLNAVTVKEPDSVKLTKHFSSTQSLNALASSQTQLLAFNRAEPAPRHVANDRDLALLPSSPLNMKAAARQPYQQGSLPSPEHSITLAIRTKISQDCNSFSRPQAPRSSPISPMSLDHSYSHNSLLKYRNEADLAVRLLRERTNYMMPLYDGSDATYDADCLASSSKSSSEVSCHASVHRSAIGTAMTTDTYTLQQPPTALSFPLQSEVHPTASHASQSSLKVAAQPAARSGDSVLSTVSSLHADEILYEASSAWLDSSLSSISHDDTAHNELALISYEDDSLPDGWQQSDPYHQEYDHDHSSQEEIEASSVFDY